MTSNDLSPYAVNRFETVDVDGPESAELLAELGNRFAAEISDAKRQGDAVRHLLEGLHGVGHRFLHVSITDLAEIGIEGEDVVFEAREVIADGRRLLSIEADHLRGLRVTLEPIGDDLGLYDRTAIDRLDLDDQTTARRTLDGLRLMLFAAVLRHGIEGAERTITRLQDLGHDFERTEDKRRQKSWQAESHGGRGRLRISASSKDSGWALVTLSEVQPATPAESDVDDEDHRQQEAFYELATELADRYDDYPSLPERDRLILAVHLLEGEVQNGGFAQYFYNTEGHQARDAARFLESIGARVAAELTRSALALFPDDWDGGLSDEIADLIDRHDEALDALDDRFYDEAEHIALLAMRHVESMG